MEQKEFMKLLTKAMADRKIVIGTDRVLKGLKGAKLSVVGHASNTPEKVVSQMEAGPGGAKMFSFPGNNVEFGEICKRPHRVSVVGILKE